MCVCVCTLEVASTVDSTAELNTTSKIQEFDSVYPQNQMIRCMGKEVKVGERADFAPCAWQAKEENILFKFFYF